MTIMSEIGSTSIDTPKRTSLQHDLSQLRRELKDFEKRFLAENGRKPKPDDVKQNVGAAAKYKKYNRIQDVLSGKLKYEELKPKSKNASNTERRDSGIGSSPRQQKKIVETPRKLKQPLLVESNDESIPASPQQYFRTAIGPTPHRDGKVLGLFDSLDPSDLSASSSCRKRKIDALYSDTPVQRTPLKIIQTPSRRSERRQNDLLDHLQGTPVASREATKLSRTPQSDGRKFQLSQFFATPTTQRVLFSTTEQKIHATPLRDAILKGTPQKVIDSTNLDTTPTYLKRSTSFKDRLLSASHDDSTEQKRPYRIGPPTLKHFRSSTSNILSAREMIPDKPPVQNECNNNGDDYDDDLEALREMENGGTASKVLVQDSQRVETFSDPDDTGVTDDADVVPRTYKKKGQKRTTRKAAIKPASFTKKVSEPSFVAADEFDDDEEDDNLTPKDHDQECSNEHGPDHVEVTREERKSSKKDSKSGKTSGKRAAGKMNPNAQSHMNFRTLKIKNKNSRAKNAGSGKFTRRR